MIQIVLQRYMFTQMLMKHKLAMPVNIDKKKFIETLFNVFRGDGKIYWGGGGGGR